MTDLASCKKSRSAIAGWLTRASKGCETLSKQSCISKEEFEYILQTFDSRISEYDKAQRAVEFQIEETELDNEIETCGKFRDQCVVHRITLMKKYNAQNQISSDSINNTSMSNGHGNSRVKLPKLDLPKFSGDILKYSSFWQQFVAAVDAVDMPDVSKYNYLVSSLKGPALKVLEGLPITEEHYPEAKKLIQKRFGRSEVLIFAHIQALLGTEVPEIQTPKLQSFMDNLTAHVRALEALGINRDKFGVILTPIVVSKLPTEIRMEWSRDSSGKEGDLDYLLTFLEAEIQRRERNDTFGTLSDPKSAKDKDRKHGHGSTGSALLTGTSSYGHDQKPKCAFCDKVGHKAQRCLAYLELPPGARHEKVSSSGLCFRCLEQGHMSKACDGVCKACNRPHHISLCWGNAGNRKKPAKSNVAGSSSRDGDSTAGGPARAPSNGDGNGVTDATVLAGDVSKGSERQSSQSSVLPMVTVEINNGGPIVKANLLLDSGATKSYISRHSVKRVSPEWLSRERCSYTSFGGISVNSYRNIFKIVVNSVDGPVDLVLIEVPTICAPISRPVCKSEHLFEHLEVAPSACGSVSIDILVGLDQYWSIVRSGVYKPEGEAIVAQETIFGWVVSGVNNDSSFSENNSQLLSVSVSDEDIQNLFWDLSSSCGTENYGVLQDGDVAEAGGCGQPAVDQLVDNVEYVESEGRYQVRLTWKSDPSELENNFKRAMALNKAMTSRLASQDEALMASYNAALQEMETLGFVEEVPPSEVESSKFPVFYLPHHPRVRESSMTTKVRPVFNASIKGPNGVSLNDCLHAGPNLNPSIVELLLRFRRWGIALTADVTKAFLQILLDPRDRDVHRFIWSVDGKTRIMRFVRVTFGIACSPFLLAAVIRFHLSQCVPSRTVTELSDNMYVDDLLSGDDTEEGARALFLNANHIMSSAGMELAKWTSNDDLVFQQCISSSDSTKVLGMTWIPGEDTLSFVTIDIPESFLCTKRLVLSFIARVYDPVGLILPFTVRARFLFQDVWRLGISWNELLPEDKATEFRSWLSDLPHFQDLKLPRQYFSLSWSDTVSQLEFHVFGDASTRGYGACIYLKCTLPNGEVRCTLVRSCARVAPLEKRSLPRLELAGCLLAARLLDSTRRDLRLLEIPYTCWTDSMVALAWIKGDPSRWKVWVANRVIGIQSLVEVDNFKHCRGVENPADLLTRGVAAEKLLSSKLWWNGSPFLLSRSSEVVEGLNSQPTKDVDVQPEVLVETRSSRVDSVLLNVNDQTCFEFERYSSLSKCYRVVAWCRRFIWNVRCRVRKTPDECRQGDLSLEELAKARSDFILNLQRHHFADDIAAVKSKGSVSRTSKLVNLAPYLDAEGFLRVKSRLGLSDLAYESKFPIILPRCHGSELLLKFYHHSMCHIGVDSLITRARAEFEIFGLRPMAKRVKRSCVSCKRYDSLPCNQEVAPLPAVRVTQAPPFTVTGIDLAGPVFAVDVEKKLYICLFVCGVVRCVHLELVDSLSREDLLLGYRRFCALKRSPTVVYSDQGKNLTSARSLLQKYLGPHVLKWNLICPRSPWWGGWWERLVRSTKSALKKTVGKRCLTKSELITVLAEVAAAVNSRPLTYAGTDVENKPPLTPNHFLSGMGYQALEGAIVEDPENVNRSLFCRRVQVMLSRLDHFWKVWSSEYIRNLPTAFQKFRKYGNLKEGSIVLIREDKQPRMRWLLGRVVKLHAGRDGLPRSADLLTASGPRTRPIQRLYDMEVCEPPEDAKVASSTQNPVAGVSSQNNVDPVVDNS